MRTLVATQHRDGIARLGMQLLPKPQLHTTINGYRQSPTENGPKHELKLGDDDDDDEDDIAIDWPESRLRMPSYRFLGCAR